jgi:hypothetical protein
MKKLAMVCVTVGMGTWTAMAEFTRTLLVEEGKLPDRGQLEVGGWGIYQEITEQNKPNANDNVGWLVPMARLGLTPELAASLQVPFGRSEIADDVEVGLGDIQVGLDLIGYRGALGYPYVMPFARLALPTGDDEKRLGRGETQFKVGLAAGTTVADDWDFVASAGFVARSDTDNSVQLGAAVIYMFRPQFQLLGEIMFETSTDENVPDRATVLGGFLYRPTEPWLFGVYGGVETGSDIEENFVGGLKLVRSF